MARQVKQFRYYNDSNTHKKNYPENLKLRHLVTGSVFDPYPRILQLGIQALPGTKFYLNNANNPVIVGSTGIYELTLTGATVITDLTFDNASIQAIGNNNNASLIIDIIYEVD